MKSRKEGKQHRLKLVVRNAQFVFVFFLFTLKAFTMLICSVLDLQTMEFYLFIVWTDGGMVTTDQSICL